MASIKVLILYQFKEHEEILVRLKKEVEKNSVFIDLFNVRTLSFYSSSKYNFFNVTTSIPKIRVLIYWMFRKQKILRLSEKYDVVDVHFFSTIYDNILDNLKPKKKISFWGSDIYRISDFRKSNLARLTSKADMIRFNTVAMFERFEYLYENKSNLNYQIFGNNLFELISEKNYSIEKAKQKIGLNPKKIAVFVGYNSSKGQQHELIYSQLKDLKPDLKDKIQIVLPLTYGSSKDKKSLIEALFIGSGFNTISYKEKLNLDELCCLRLSADIVLNFQISDAFSASLQEHFFSNSIMILANWLPYEWLKQKGIYFHSINSEEIVFTLTKVIGNMMEEKNKSNENKKIISNISSWDKVSKSWCADYRTLINN